MEGSIHIPETVGPLVVTVDLRSNRVTCYVDLEAVRTVPLGRVVVEELAAQLATFGPAGDGSIFTDLVGPGTHL